jgi:uncharacterized protein YggE
MRFLVLVLFFLVPMSAIADEKASTITVQGEAIKEVKPDKATLRVTVNEEKPLLTEAKQEHDKKLRILLKLAQDVGVEKDKIQTGYAAITPVYDYIENKKHLRGYEVQTSLSFVFTDLSKPARFMDQVLNAGIDTVDGINYGIQNEDSLKKEMLSSSVKNAYDKASLIAEAAKVTIDKPLTIEEGGIQWLVQPMSPPRPRMKGMVTAANITMASPELPSGLIEIRQNVTITYLLK